ncbi:putative reverse transcriptase domain-containing protein [Tanacetum coccineum]
MPPRMRTRSAGRPVAESLRGGTGVRVSRGGRGRRPREGNDERVDDLNVLTRWIKKMEYVHDMSGCSIDQKVKYPVGSFVGKALTWAGHAAYTDRFYELDRLVPHLVTLESMMIERYISGALTDEAVRNGSIKKVEKRGNVGEPSKDKNGKDDNNRTRTGNVFATTVNPVGRENTVTWPKGVLRNVNPVNARNPTVRTCYECGLEPSELGFKYEIEIASGQLVEIDKVIKGCKLEIEGHVFDIDLIHFGHGSFDVIIGMDSLSKYKGEIICHEKVVRIPLPDGKVLRVLGERPKEKARFLMGAKAGDKKQEEIVVVRDFPEVFLDDLSGLTPIREIEFRTELIPEQHRKQSLLIDSEGSIICMFSEHFNDLERGKQNVEQLLIRLVWNCSNKRRRRRKGKEETCNVRKKERDEAGKKASKDREKKDGKDRKIKERRKKGNERKEEICTQP